MANLRDLIDGRSVDMHSKSDVFNTLKDVKDKQSDVDLATLKLHQKLAPARQLLQLVDQDHPMPGSQQQQQFDQNGNPIPMQNQQQPGQQMNPASGAQQTNQNMKQGGQQQMPGQKMQPGARQKKSAFGNANKSSTKDKMNNNKNKKQVGGKKGVEIHVKAKSERKKLHGRFDYHDDAGKDDASGRGIGLSTSSKKCPKCGKSMSSCTCK